MALLLSDERLTRRAVGGDERAFAEIFDRYHEPLYRFCLSIVGDPQDAQDALQNAMVKVLRALPGEQREIELKPWLYRIAHNESVELLRRRRPVVELDPELAGRGDGLAEEAAQRQRLARLLADLGELSERQRGALVMRELGGLDFEEIGAALGTSAATARQTVYEARLGLREMETGREMSCDAVTRAISDGDGRVLRRRDIRTHLRGCEGCRLFRDEIAGRERELAALAPMPAVAVAAMLKGLLGGNGAGGGIGAALGGGAAKSVVASTFFKGVATVAVVAAVGITADRSGLVDPGSGGQGGQAKSSQSAGSLPAQRVPSTTATPATAPGQGRSASGAAAPQRGSTGDKGGGAKGGEDKPATVPAGGHGTTAPAAVPGSAATPAAGHHQLPAASSHGQQTAAAHKETGKEVSATARESHPPASTPPAAPAPEPPAQAASPAKPEAPDPEVAPAAGKGTEKAAAAQAAHGRP